MVKKSVKSVKPASTKTSSKVDYYPNRMGLAVASAAAVILTVLGVIAYYN